MNLVKIKRTSDTALSLTWDNGETTDITLQKLRDECPCAGCKGETVLFETYQPVKLNVLTPGMYELKKIGTVGNYSIQPLWGDGHNTGLYSWDYLYHISAAE
ncbi:MAG: DUF971 domain-containing protein [Rhizobacter sp.]|nr:DUF971 domain-containing protein [Chlorobiales bacterium]